MLIREKLQNFLKIVYNTDYLDKLKLNVPEHLLKLLADCMKLFLIKAEIDKKEIAVITEKLYQMNKKQCILRIFFDIMHCFLYI